MFLRSYKEKEYQIGQRSEGCADGPIFKLQRSVIVTVASDRSHIKLPFDVRMRIRELCGCSALKAHALTNLSLAVQSKEGINPPVLAFSGRAPR
jgi:hypothetical protein